MTNKPQEVEFLKNVFYDESVVFIGKAKTLKLGVN